MLTQLQDVLTQPSGPYILELAGIGGIGKTTIARELVLTLAAMGDYAGIGWVSARQQWLHPLGMIQPVDITGTQAASANPKPDTTVDTLLRDLIRQLWMDLIPSDYETSEQFQNQVCERLKSAPYLIVIDNLETVHDLASLAPFLRRSANPTRFLLTTRQSLRGEPGVTPFTVPELARADALQLVRSEADAVNLKEIATASDDDLDPIYQTVGGNPLAIQLIIGQLHTHALQTVLTALTEARGRPVNQLYTFIYRHAWDHLDDETRSVFLAMPLLPQEGGRFETLEKINGIDPETLYDALGHLIMLNLVNHYRLEQSNSVSTDTNSHIPQYESYYAIHSLTRSFLLEQVIKWKSH
ncbi:hypothetical protein KFU94_03905 [Chloroflexi bacterium TSY]|nr:hypothetical protein [Chloroflexi bacterium TSY]